MKKITMTRSAMSFNIAIALRLIVGKHTAAYFAIPVMRIINLIDYYIPKTK
jgi:hypothetical protein